MREMVKMTDAIKEKRLLSPVLEGILPTGTPVETAGPLGIKDDWNLVSISYNYKAKSNLSKQKVFITFI